MNAIRQTQSPEFRFRFLIHFVIILLGFTTPWDRWLHVDSSGPNAHVWGTLAANLAMVKPGAISISTSFNLLLVTGIVFAVAAALLRTWASAYMGASTVQDSALHGDRMVTAGPYRYLRNPLYVGIFLHVLALALLMPPSGAIFAIVAMGLFELRLMMVEESFLSRTLGEPYLAYCAKVPRLFPALRPRVDSSVTASKWPMAFLSEIYMWGVAIAFISVGWRYNSLLIIQGVIISLGVSLVVRAAIAKG